MRFEVFTTGGARLTDSIGPRVFYSAVRVRYVFMISTRYFWNMSLCNGYSITGLVCLRIGLHWSSFDLFRCFTAVRGTYVPTCL